MVATFSPQSLRATHRNEVLLSQWRDTALLFTCRTMYNEGLSILYSHNKLHFPILTKGVMLNQRQGSSFSLLTSVSIPERVGCVPTPGLLDHGGGSTG